MDSYLVVFLIQGLKKGGVLYVVFELIYALIKCNFGITYLII